jgi:hypothetical protein
MDREVARVGLCFDCLHGRRIQSDRGSVFLSVPSFRQRSDVPEISSAAGAPLRRIPEEFGSW